MLGKFMMSKGVDVLVYPSCKIKCEGEILKRVNDLGKKQLVLRMKVWKEIVLQVEFMFLFEKGTRDQEENRIRNG